MLLKDRAICIRVTDYSETSQIVTLFTRGAGKVRAIAKGVKRPKSVFDGPIELLSCGQIVFSTPTSGGLATLREFRQERGYVHLRRDLTALHCCILAAELLDSLTDDRDPHPGLFDAFVELVEAADAPEGGDRREMLCLLIVFELTVLEEVGLWPVLQRCVNCKRKYDKSWPVVYFSSRANGLLCRDCEGSFAEKVQLSKAAAACLSRPEQLAEASSATVRQIETVLLAHFRELLGRPLRLAKYVLGGPQTGS